VVNPNRFYTYAYLREDRTPYYIGKGKDNRVYKTHQKGISVPKDESRIIFLKQNLTEEDAFKHEIYMIAVLGRKDLGTGILRNRSDGGDGPSGAVRSEEWKRNRSESMRGENNHNYGKSFSKEHKIKLSMTKKGENNHNYGKRGEESHWYGKTGKNHPAYGRKNSKEFRERHSELLKGKNIGKKWWNDGCGNTKFAIECPGEGWILGRGKKRHKDT
jgi:hypothetical protein